MNLDEWMTQCTADLAEAEAKLQAAQARVTELRTIQEGIQLAKQRYGHEDQADPSVTQSRPAKSVSNRGRPVRRKSARRPLRGHSDLCLNLVTETASRQIDLDAACEALAEQGYELDREQVRNGFGYLLRTGQVVRVDPGVYALNSSHEGEPEVAKSASS